MRSRASGRGTTPSKGKHVHQQVDSLLLWLQPTVMSDERRRAVLRYVEGVVRREVPTCKVFPVGSFPLKTYLPCADVDMVMFVPPASSAPGGSRAQVQGSSLAGGTEEGTRPGLEEASSSSAVAVVDRREAEVSAVSQAPTPALVSVNRALCAVAAETGCGRRTSSAAGLPSGESAKPEIRKVSFINARTPIVTMVVGNIAVDLTENQAGSVAASALLEEADRWIGRDHLFKRSLLLLKAWALCETPRMVGQKVLGAREGGLTSYGLSVMVLHLFARASSAEALQHPLDVLVRFFLVYSEFDWGRHCLTLDGPVAFDDIRERRNASSREVPTSSQLWPLVDRVLVHLSSGSAERTGGRFRGRRGAGGAGTRFGASDGSSTRRQPTYWGVSVSPATAHFPVRHCNIQDPLNMLNNLGHSVSRRSLKALEAALRQGRHLLESMGLCPSSCVPQSGPPAKGETAQQRRPRQPEAGDGSRSKDIGRARGVGRERGSPGSERIRADERAGSAGGGREERLTPTRAPMAPLPLGHVQTRAPPPAPAPADPLGAQGAVAQGYPPPTPPPLHFVRLPAMQAAAPPHPGVVYTTQPVVMPGAVSGTHQLRLTHVAPPLLPNGYQLVYHPHMVSSEHSGVPAQGHAVLLPAGVQARPEYARRWHVQPGLPGGYYAEARQVMLEQQQQSMYARTDIPPPTEASVQAGNHVWHDAGPHGTLPQASGSPSRPRAGDKNEPCSTDQAVEQGSLGRGGPDKDNGSTRMRQKRTEDVGGPHNGRQMRGPIVPWDLPPFVHASPTSSTASMSEFADDAGKEEHEFHSLDEGARGGATGLPLPAEAAGVAEGASDGAQAESDVAANGSSLQKRGAGLKQGRKTAAAAPAATAAAAAAAAGPVPTAAAAAAATAAGRSAKEAAGLGSSSPLSSVSFLKEFFPHCCQVYASGDGFREDLLDHPCQHWSKLQERGAPPQRRPGSRDILEGASEEMWSALETVEQIVRRDSLSPAIGKSKLDEKTTPGAGGGVEADVSCREVKGNDAGSTRHLEQRVAQTRNTDDADLVGEERNSRCERKPWPSATNARRTGGGNRRPRSMAAVDDDNGYTTGEEQGDKADTPTAASREGAPPSAPSLTASGPEPPRAAELPALAPPLKASWATRIPPREAPSRVPAKEQGTQCIVPAVSSVERGSQCAGPQTVSTSAQCVEVPKVLRSASVQCNVPSPKAPGISCGTQCGWSTPTSTRSVSVQTCPTLAGADARRAASEQLDPGLVGDPSGESAAVGRAGRDTARDVAQSDFRDDESSASSRPLTVSTTEDSAAPTAEAPGVDGGAIAAGDDLGEAFPLGGIAAVAAASTKSKKKRKKGKSAGAGPGTRPNEEPESVSDRAPAAGGGCASSAASASATTTAAAAAKGSKRDVKSILRLVAAWLILNLGLYLVGGLRLKDVLGGTGGSSHPIAPREGRRELGAADDRTQAPVWVTVGSSLTLGDVIPSARDTGRVGASSGDAFQWWKNGRPIAGQTSSFLTISATSLHDEGTYACFVVGKSAAALWKEVTVRVSEPPVVEPQLQTQRFARGEMLVVVATASGTPTPEYQWRRNGVPIPGAKSAMYVKHGVTEADMGTYTCDVYNVAGHAQWEEMAVIWRDDGSDAEAERRFS